MEIISFPVRVDLIVSDVDKTLYGESAGVAYVADGEAGEDLFLASKLSVSLEEAQQLLDQKRIELGRPGKKGSRSHAMYALGVTLDEWSRVRCACYFPEDFLQPNQALVKAIAALPMPVVAVTNSPREIGRRVLLTLGMSQLLRQGKILIFGPEDCGFSKPDPRIYTAIAERLGATLGYCLSIGDHRHKDCEIPLQAGYGGAVCVNGPDEVIEIFRGAQINGGNFCLRR